MQAHSSSYHKLITSRSDQAFWWVLALAFGGTLAYLGQHALAGLLAATWLIVSQHKAVIEVDVAANQYRVGTQLFGICLADWQRLPMAQRVVVRYFSQYAVSYTDSGAEETEKSQDYIVLLSVPNAAQGHILFRSPHYKQAMRAGCFLGNALNLEVVEFTRYQELVVVQEAPEPAAE